jgi:uncharacterized membrane protein YdfJ with MMPL/SSD domain
VGHGAGRRGRRRGGVGSKTSDKFTVPGTESQQAQELLEQNYPAASGTYARLVFAAPKGEKLTDPETKAAVEATLAKATDAKDVSAVTDPYETKALTAGGRGSWRRSSWAGHSAFLAHFWRIRAIEMPC